MTLTFVTGLASDDHRQMLLKEIAALAVNQPDSKVFYLVPNHIKFDAEVDILTRYGTATANNNTTTVANKLALIAETQLQVFSIKRLIWYFMSNTPQYQQARISKSGLYMLVRRAFQQAQGLQIFQRMSQKSGFIEQLANQISEFRLSNITAADLKSLALDASGELKQKLNDLAIILNYVETEITDKIITDTDLLNVFAAWLSSQDLTGMHFYFEGFSQFTAAERRVLEVLIAKADVTLALVTDAKPKFDGTDSILKVTGFFGRTNKLINDLSQFAHQLNVAIKINQKPLPTRELTKGMRGFEKLWLAAQGSGTKVNLTLAETQTIKQAVKIYAADSLQTEVEQVARYIRQQVSAPNSTYRYQDFLIVARDLNQYHTMITPIFKRYQIPIFTDLDFAMTNHPLVEFLRAILEIANATNKNYYQYYTLMRMLKTQLLRPTNMDADDFRKTLDYLENYLLAFNPRKNDWEGDDEWFFTRSEGVDEDWQLISVDSEINAKVNQIRHFIVAQVTKIRAQLQQATTMGEALTVLYQWLIAAGVTDVLSQWREVAANAGDVIATKQPEEVWQMFIDTLDDMHTLVGDEPYDIEVFVDTIMAGFSGAKFSGIPATIDNVQISEMGIVQNDNYRVVMMLGGTKLNLPAHLKNHTLLSDRNRDDIKPLNSELYLRDTSREQMAEEPLLAYLSWSRAKETLILSYPTRNSDGVTQQISPYLAKISAQLGLNPNEIGKWVAQPQMQTPLADVHQFIGTPRSTLNHLATIKRQAITQKQPLPKIWQYLNDYLVAEESLTNKILAALNYSNKSQTLAPALVTELFKNKVQVSISKLETYNQNPYEYFLRHGLKLQERPVFELTAADSGQIFHKILETTINELLRQQTTPGSLTLEQAQALILAQANEVFANPAFKILKSSSRMAFMQQQLLKVVNHTFDNLRRASKMNNSKPFGTEISFGRSFANENTWQGLTFDLGAGKSMQINGKIDRLDTDMVGNNIFVNVIDYKSGLKKFDFTMAYNGLALQLLTYLLAVKANTKQLAQLKLADSQQIKLGGAMFAHISNPKKKLKDIGTFSDDVLSTAGLALIDDELSYDFSYQGLLLKDQDFLQSLQQDLGYPGKANYYDFSFTKKGIGSNNTVLEENDINSLLAYNEHILKATGANILAGEFPIAPVRYGSQQTALQYSPFTAIMSFDALIDNQYHDLEKISASEVIEVSQLTAFLDTVAQLTAKDHDALVIELEKHEGIAHGGVLSDIKAFEHDTVAEALTSLVGLEKLTTREKNSYLKIRQLEKAEMQKQELAAEKAKIKHQKEQDKQLKDVAKVVKKYKKVTPLEALQAIKTTEQLDFATLIAEIDVLHDLNPEQVVAKFQAVTANKLDEIIAEVKNNLKGEY